MRTTDDLALSLALVMLLLVLSGLLRALHFISFLAASLPGELPAAAHVHSLLAFVWVSRPYAAVAATVADSPASAAAAAAVHLQNMLLDSTQQAGGRGLFLNVALRVLSDSMQLHRQAAVPAAGDPLQKQRAQSFGWLQALQDRLAAICWTGSICRTQCALWCSAQPCSWLATSCWRMQ